MTAGDVLREQVEAGIAAERVLEVTGPYLAKREKDTVDALIQSYLVKGWDERTALRYVSCLGEIRTQRDELAYAASKAADARKKLYGQA